MSIADPIVGSADVTQLLVALFVGLGAAVQALTGFGFGLVCSPFLVAALGPVKGIATSVVLASALNVAILLPQARNARPSRVWLIFAFSAIAAFLTARFVSDFASAPISIAAGLVTLVAAALLWFRPTTSGSGKVSQALAGTMSGIMNSAAGVGGPPVVLHATAAGWPRPIVVPTLQLYFLATNAFTLVGLRHIPSITAIPLVAMVVGLIIGGLLRGRLSEPAARRATLLLAAIGGAIVIVSSLGSLT